MEPRNDLTVMRYDMILLECSIGGYKVGRTEAETVRTLRAGWPRKRPADADGDCH
jgi:hypothetical protein